MKHKKTKLDTAADIATDIIQAHLDALPREQARAMVQEIRDLALKSSRSASRGKALRSRQNVGLRPLSRSCAESA